MASLHNQVKKWVKESGQAIAVQDGTETLSYEQLNQRIENIMVHLEALPEVKDIRKNQSCIAICAEKNALWYSVYLALIGLNIPIALMVGDMTGAKADDRNKAIIKELQPELVICDDQFSGVFGVKSVVISTLDRSVGPEQEIVPPEGKITNPLMCYVHTGGTTRASKCVQITHAMAMHEMEAYPRIMKLSSTDKFLCHSSTYWGAAVTGQIDVALAFGCCLVFQKNELDLTRIINEFQLTCIGCVPSQLDAISGETPSVHTVIAWAEKMSSATAKAWLAKGVNLVELLIASEYWVTFYAYSGEDVLRPIDVPSIQLKLLQAEGFPSDTFELLIGGDCVTSLGYVDNQRESLNDEGFLEASEAEQQAGVCWWYRTRDLVRTTAPTEAGRMLPSKDVSFKYVGRNDSLFKYGGQWVDMLQCEEEVKSIEVFSTRVVRDCAMVLLPGSELVVFVVLSKFCPEALKRLKSLKCLPPSVKLQVLSELPRNEVTGKVDRKTLIALVEPQEELELREGCPSSRAREVQAVFMRRHLKYYGFLLLGLTVATLMEGVWGVVIAALLPYVYWGILRCRESNFYTKHRTLGHLMWEAPSFFPGREVTMAIALSACPTVFRLMVLPLPSALQFPLFSGFSTALLRVPPLALGISAIAGFSSEDSVSVALGRGVVFYIGYSRLIDKTFNRGSVWRRWLREMREPIQRKLEDTLEKVNVFAFLWSFVEAWKVEEVEASESEASVACAPSFEPENADMQREDTIDRKEAPKKRVPPRWKKGPELENVDVTEKAVQPVWPWAQEVAGISSSCGGQWVSQPHDWLDVGYGEWDGAVLQQKMQHPLGISPTEETSKELKRSEGLEEAGVTKKWIETPLPHLSALAFQDKPGVKKHVPEVSLDNLGCDPASLRVVLESVKAVTDWVEVTPCTSLSGLDSLRAVALVNLLSKKLKKKMGVVALMKAESVLDLTKSLEKAGDVSEGSPPWGEKEEEDVEWERNGLIRMSVWGWNSKCVWCLSSKTPLDSRALNKASQALVQRHDSFRLDFHDSQEVHTFYNEAAAALGVFKSWTGFLKSREEGGHLVVRCVKALTGVCFSLLCLAGRAFAKSWPRVRVWWVGYPCEVSPSPILLESKSELRTLVGKARAKFYPSHLLSVTHGRVPSSRREEGDPSDYVVFVASHAVVDGFSAVPLFTEFLHLYDKAKGKLEEVEGREKVDFPTQKGEQGPQQADGKPDRETEDEDKKGHTEYDNKNDEEGSEGSRDAEEGRISIKSTSTCRTLQRLEVEVDSPGGAQELDLLPLMGTRSTSPPSLDMRKFMAEKIDGELEPPPSFPKAAAGRLRRALEAEVLEGDHIYLSYYTEEYLPFTSGTNRVLHLLPPFIASVHAASALLGSSPDVLLLGVVLMAMARVNRWEGVAEISMITSQRDGEGETNGVGLYSDNRFLDIPFSSSSSSFISFLSTLTDRVKKRKWTVPRPMEAAFRPQINMRGSDLGSGLLSGQPWKQEFQNMNCEYYARASGATRPLDISIDQISASRWDLSYRGNDREYPEPLLLSFVSELKTVLGFLLGSPSSNMMNSCTPEVHRKNMHLLEHY